MRAVVFVTSDTKKGTSRAGQEYESPLLVLTGVEYIAMSFQDLHDRLCDALRGARPRLVSQVFVPGSASTLLFDDGSTPSAAKSALNIFTPATLWPTCGDTVHLVER